jgi:hypothetical protein
MKSVHSLSDVNAVGHDRQCSYETTERARTGKTSGLDGAPSFCVDLRVTFVTGFTLSFRSPMMFEKRCA